MLEVSFGHRGDVLTAEDTDLEFLDVGVDGRAGGDEVWKFFVDHGVGTNVLGDLFFCAAKGDEFAGVGEVDTINVGIPLILVSRLTRILGLQEPT